MLIILFVVRCTYLSLHRRPPGPAPGGSEYCIYSMLLLMLSQNPLQKMKQ